MKPSHILLVEDTVDVLDYNRHKLEEAGYRVSAAGTLEAARERISADPPDLIVLDILLPDGSGLDLCRQLRRFTAPILLLTSLAESSQIVQGLRAGGDDYITKPYRIEELLARIEAQLRRVETLRSAVPDTGSDRLRLDPKLQRAFLDGDDLLLKPKEYLLLSTLAQNRTRHMTAEELYAEVWSMAPNNDLRTVLVHISSLRLKLRQDERGGSPVRIERTGKGYRLALSDEEECR